MYWKKTVVRLIYSEANRVRPTSYMDGGMAADGSSFPVESGSVESAGSIQADDLGSNLGSAAGKVDPPPDAEFLKKQLQLLNSSTPEPETFGAGNTKQPDTTSRKRNDKEEAEEESIFEKSVPRRRIARIKPTAVTRYTKVPGERSSKLYDLVCSEESKYKQ